MATPTALAIQSNPNIHIGEGVCTRLSVLERGLSQMEKAHYCWMETWLPTLLTLELVSLVQWTVIHFGVTKKPYSLPFITIWHHQINDVAKWMNKEVICSIKTQFGTKQIFRPLIMYWFLSSFSQCKSSECHPTSTVRLEVNHSWPLLKTFRFCIQWMEAVCGGRTAELSWNQLKTYIRNIMQLKSHQSQTFCSLYLSRKGLLSTCLVAPCSTFIKLQCTTAGNWRLSALLSNNGWWLFIKKGSSNWFLQRWTEIFQAWCSHSTRQSVDTSKTDILTDIKLVFITFKRCDTLLLICSTHYHINNTTDTVFKYQATQASKLLPNVEASFLAALLE